MNRPFYFEIPADSPDKIRKFFEGAFGWKFTKWDLAPMEYWTISTGDKNSPGIDGGLMKKQHPQQPMVNTIEVADLDDAIKNVEKNGGVIVLPKMPVPTVGYLACFKDPEGNIFGIMQSDKGAK